MRNRDEGFFTQNPSRSRLLILKLRRAVSFLSSARIIFVLPSNVEILQGDKVAGMQIFGDRVNIGLYPPPCLNKLQIYFQILFSFSLL